MMRTHFMRQCGLRALAAVALVALGLLASGFGQAAQAQTTTTCELPGSKGNDGPVDWGAYCWIDFSSYSATQARNGGQNYLVRLPGGATLTFTLSVASNNLTPAAVPSWSGAAFGNSAFLGIPGSPVLYQNTQGAVSTITLSSLVLKANGSPDLPFVFVAADGESTNDGETLAFTTSGNPWQLVDSPGQSEPGRSMPGLSGVGTTRVTETGNTTGPTGSYVFTTNNSPGTVAVEMHGTGLEGVLFGLRFHSIDLAITNTYAGDAFAGGSGRYQLDVSNTITANENPPTSPQPIRVIDTLPTGITYTSATGAGWNCAASGQTVTCDLAGADLNTTPGVTVDLPPLTLNVAIDINAPATLTNTANVQDHTTGYVFDTNQENNTASVTTAVARPDLSTSAKSVVDLNGGDAEPGDTLRYTITLTESGGAPANAIHVTDAMPANVHGLTVTNSAGGTDNSTPAGGANGTGELDISMISVPANGSKTIVYDVTIDSGVANGTTIDNTASIDTPNIPGSPDASPAAPTVTIAQSQVPASGNKILYVYDNLALSRTPQAAGGGGVSIDSNGDAQTWTLTIPLAKALTLQANSTVSVTLLVQCDSQYRGDCRSSNRLDFTARLYDKDGASLTQVGATSPEASFNHTSYTLVTTNIAIGAGAVTVAAGHQLALRITNTTNRDDRALRVEQWAGGNRSTVTVSVSTVINVDSVGTYDDANCTNPTNPVYETNGKVYVCAIVSDPFGSYDIAPATGGTLPAITITDANATQQVNAAAMTEVADSGAATKTFRYTWTLPTAPPATLALGTWTASVTVWEGTEHTVSHTANGTFAVGAPDLVIVKSVSAITDPAEGTTRAKALPGATVRYAIAVTNQGNGPIDAGQLVVTDPIPAHTAFVVGSVTGSGAGSGLPALNASNVSYSSDGGATWTYTPAAGSNGTDPAVTNIRVTPAGSMLGKTASPAPAYTVRFDVRVQ